jgi:hypothetical protein
MAFDRERNSARHTASGALKQVAGNNPNNPNSLGKQVAGNNPNNPNNLGKQVAGNNPSNPNSLGKQVAGNNPNNPNNLGKQVAFITLLITLVTLHIINQCNHSQTAS